MKLVVHIFLALIFFSPLISPGQAKNGEKDIRYASLNTKRIPEGINPAGNVKAETATGKVNDSVIPNRPDCLPLPVPTIIGPQTTCSGTGGYIYVTESGMTNYIWGISPGGTITSGTGSNSVVVSWNVAGSRWINLNYTNSSGCAALTPTVWNVEVDSSLVAGLTVTASSNPVCTGLPVTFTATPVNGGLTPAFQWKRNGINVGSGNISYTYIPSNGDQITCEMTSSLSCSTGSPVLSAPVVISVIQSAPAGISITVSANPVCTGSQVTYMATAYNGGLSPAFQWKVNGTASGTNSPLFIYTPVNADIITCIVTSNAACVTGNPATSNAIAMTVSSNQLVSVSISASANPSCQGNPVTYIAVPTTGGTSPSFQWMVNGTNAGGNSTTFTHNPVNGDIITCRLTSNASCTTGNPALSNPISMSVHQGAVVSVSIAASTNPVCQGNSVTYTATAVNPGSSPVYQWSVNGYEIGSNSLTYTYVPANGDIVNCKLTSGDNCATGNPATSNQVTMTVSSVLPVSISIAASSNPVCVGTDVTFNAVPYNSGANPVYQWKLNGINAGTNSTSYTYSPATGDVVTCQMTSSASCITGNNVTSNAVTMTVSNNLPVSVTIAASSTQVCQGMTPIFTATPVNGGPSPSFQWKVNGINTGPNSSIFSYNAADGDIVSCQVTSSIICATGNPAISNSIPMTVTTGQALPVSVSITASANPSCQGHTVTYTATPVNGGTTPIYQWAVNGLNVGTNSPVFSYIPTHGDFVMCQLTSSYSCATGNPATSGEVIMTVNPNLNVSVGITCSANPSCQGSLVTFTATAVNAGSSPTYQWKVNGVNSGSNQSTFSYTPATNDIVTCQLTSSVGCPVSNPVTSNIITMTVQPVQPVTISIATLTNPSCKSTQVTFSASATNGGTAPQYQWKLNGSNVGSNSQLLIFIPVNGDIISCQYTSNAICVSGPRTVNSNAITMTVSTELPAGVSITSASNPFCEGTPVIFTATPVNGGTAPIYQWRVNCASAGTNNPVFTYNPLDGDFVTCKMTSNLTCAILNPTISNGINMTSTGLNPVSVTIAATQTTVCQGSTVTFTATPVNGGSAPVYQWKVNGTNAGTNNAVFTYTPVNGDIVTCKLTSNLACAKGNPAVSNSISMTVSTSLPASVSIATLTNPYCPGPVVFTATSANGGNAPVYHWEINSANVGLNSSTYTYIPANGDIVTCMMTSNASCVSGTNPVTSNSITMVSATSLHASVSINSTATSVCLGTTVTYTATPTNGGENPSYQWQVNGLNSGTNDKQFSYTPVNGDIVTCTMTSSLNCATGNPAASNSYQMTVTLTAPVSITIAASSNPCCQGTNITFTATGVNGGTTPVYQWQVNCVNVGTNSLTYTYTPQNGDVVVCRMTSNQSCIFGNQAISPNINMIVLPVLPVSLTITPSVNPFCFGSNVTFTPSCVNEGPSPGYQWKVNGTNVGTGLTFSYSPSDNDVVTCQLSSSFTCVSGNPALSNPVVMRGSSALAVGVSISVSQNVLCSGNFVVFTATPTNPGANPVYQWKVNGILSGPNSSTFQNFPTDGDVVTCVLTSNLTCATSNPATSNPISMTVYPQAPVSITISASANPSCQGATVNYTAIPVNGGPDPIYQWKVNNINAGTSSTVFSYIPVNGDIVNCRLLSDATCRTGNPATSGNITMIVSPSDPASISIAASSNPICQGSTVTFTTNIFNGGTAPSFQWKVNGIIVGGNTSAYSYVPVNDDIVSCKMTSNSNCIIVQTVTSNTVTMTVSPVQNVSVSVAASSNPTCVGSSVIFTATAQNPGSSPVYQWKVNGVNSGGNSPVFSYVPLNNDVVICKLTSNSSCTLNNPATSNTINMTVSQSLPVSIVVTPSKNPACQGETVSYSAAPVNGGVSPAYQWRVNGINVGTNGTAYAYNPSNGDFVTCQLTSSFSCGTGNPALSTPVNMTVNPNVPVSVSISASSNPVCQGTPVIFSATPVNGGTSPVYQWKVNGIVVGSNASTYTYTPVNGDVVTCRITSNTQCPINNLYTSNAITMNVLQPTPASIQISPTVNPACQGVPITFTSTVINGGSTPDFQWKVNGTDTGSNQNSLTYVPANGDVVSCQLISGSSCVTNNMVNSNVVTMVVSTQLAVSLNITASSNPTCLGQSVILTANSTNGGANPIYQWTVNNFNVGTNNPMYSFTPSNGDVVACQLLSDLVCATGNPATSNLITMNVNQGLPVNISIGASGNPVCTGTLVNYTAYVSNGGASPTYQWKVNGVNAGTNQSSFSYVPSNEDVVSCECTATEICGSGSNATSQPITMVVSSVLPVSISISATASTLCQATPVTYTASIVNGGSLPFYKWLVNGLEVGANSPAFTYTPANGDQVQCLLISALTCADISPAPSNIITMVVGESLQAGVSISGSPSGPVCQSTPVTVSAIPLNGGTPVYQWYRNNLPVGFNQPTYTFIPMPGDFINVVMTSGIPCIGGNPATSNTLYVPVTEQLPVSVAIAANQNPVCTGLPVTFTATPVNGGTPTYQWYRNNQPVGTGQDTYSYIPANGDQVYLIMNSSLSCVSTNHATSNVVAVNVTQPLPVSVTIVADQNPVCSGLPVSLTATPVNAGTPMYQWYVNNQPAGTNQPTYSFVPAEGDVAYLTMSSGLICITGSPATSNSVTIHVSQFLPASVAVSVDQNNICQGTTVTFIATALNGGATPSYQWFKNNVPVGSGLSTYSCIPSSSDQVYVLMTSGLLCASGSPATSNTIQMSVVPQLPVSVSIAPGQNPVCSGTSVTFIATPVNGGTPLYQWFRNNLPAGGNQPAFICVPANGDQFYVVVNSSLTCISGNPSTSNTVTMTVNAPQTASVTIAANQNPVCTGAAVILTATPLNGGTPAYQWYINNLPVGSNLPTYSYIPSNSDVVKVMMTSGLNCVTGSPATSNSLTLIVNPVLPVSVSAAVSQNNICSGTSVTFTATPTNGGTPVYQWYKNNLPVGSGLLTYTYAPADGDHVYVSMTSSQSCISGSPASSNTISMIVNAPLQVGVSIVSDLNSVCAGTTVTFTATPVNGGTPVFQWYRNGTPVGSNQPTYSYIPLNGDQVNVVMTSTLTCISGSPVTSNTITLMTNPIPPAPVATANGNLLSSSAPAGNQWVFEGTLIPGATSQVYTAGDPGWYWDYVTINGCVSDTSNHVKVFGVGVEEKTEPSLLVYPVPNDGRFKIEATVPDKEKYTLSVYSGLGNKIYELLDIWCNGRWEKIIDIRPVSDGVYTVVLRNDKHRLIRMIMIHKD